MTRSNFSNVIAIKAIVMATRAAGLCGLLLLGACAAKTDFKRVFDSTAVATQDSSRSWEIAIHFSIGEPPKSAALEVFDKKIDGTFWLYVPSLEGAFTPEQITLTLQRGRLSEPFAITDLKGTVEFKAGSMVVDLQVPQKPDGKTISGYVPFVGNGTYQIKTK